MKLLKNNWARFTFWYLSILIFYESFWAVNSFAGKVFMWIAAAALAIAGIKISGKGMWPFKENLK